jgi:hypothetical protein
MRKGDIQATHQAWSALRASGLGPDRVTRSTLFPLKASSDSLAQIIWDEISHMKLVTSAPSALLSSNVPSEGTEAAERAHTTSVDRPCVLEERLKSGDEASSSGQPDLAASTSRSTGKQPNREQHDSAGRNLLEPAVRRSNADMYKDSGNPMTAVPHTPAMHNQRKRYRLTGIPRGVLPKEAAPISKPLLSALEKIREKKDGSRIRGEEKQAPMRLAPHPNLEQGFWLKFREKREVERAPQWLLDLHGYSEAESKQVVYNKLEAMAKPDAEMHGALTIFTGRARYVSTCAHDFF